MYFEIDDYRPDITPVGRAISWREGVLLSIIFHLLAVILILVFPKLFPFDAKAAQARAALLQQKQPDDTRFVFVQPRNDLAAPKPPPRAPNSDKDRVASAPERAPKPTNPLPFSRGNTPERVEAPPPPAPARGQGPAPEPQQGQQAQNDARVPVPESQSAMTLPAPPDSAGDAVAERRRRPLAGPGWIARRRAPESAALRPAGAVREPGRQRRRLRSRDSVRHQGRGVRPVDSPLHRAGQAQLVRPVLVDVDERPRRDHVQRPQGRHRSPISTSSARARSRRSTTPRSARCRGSNPTTPLPPEYPSDKAFFTVTFFYNESPP